MKAGKTKHSTTTTRIKKRKKKKRGCMPTSHDRRQHGQRKGGELRGGSLLVLGGLDVAFRKKALFKIVQEIKTDCSVF